MQRGRAIAEARRSSALILTRFRAGDIAPQPQGDLCKCVQDYEGTLKQFSDTFHSHAESINALKVLSEL